MMKDVINQDRRREISKMAGASKVAVVLLAMNKQNTAKIFSVLRDEEIREISQSMTTLGSVESDVIEVIVDKLSIIGNAETTQKILEQVFGKEKVLLYLDDVGGPVGKNTWTKLGNVNEELLASYLKNEYPQTIALIISKISPQIAAKVLSLLPQELTYEVISRMLSIHSVKKEVLEQIESTIRSDFISSISKVQKRDSHELMADIFNNFDRTNESKYMSMLEQRIPEHAEKVKELMFTFDDLIRLKPSDIVLLMRVIDKAKIPLALKGAPENIRSLFINNMSQRASKILIEDIESLGPVRIKEVDEAQGSIITKLKELINQEEIVLATGDGEDEYIQ